MEQDEQVFCDDAFDCYAWLEEAVIDRGGRVPDLVDLVPQLTLLSQSLTKSIHGKLHQLTLTGPQLQTQLDAMQRATAPLAQQLDNVVSSVGSSAATFGRATAAAVRRKEDEQDLQYLLELHEAKERLQSCSKALVEAARWEKNVRACAASIENVLMPERADKTDKKAISLAERIDEMHKSLEVLYMNTVGGVDEELMLVYGLQILKDMPGSEDRKRTMERLSSQIEAAMKPKLDEYLQANQLPVGQVQFCRAVFASIGRADYVVAAYCRCRPAQIHRAWYSYSASDGGSFASWVDSFYHEVLRMIQRETENAAEVFGAEAARVLLSLLENTLTALKDSFRDRLKKDFSIEDLLRAFQTSCAFVRQVAKALRLSDAIPDTDEGLGLDPGIAVAAVENDTADRLLSAVLAPYQFFFTNYNQIVGDALSSKLASLVPAYSSNTVREDDDDIGGAGSGENLLDGFAQRLEDVSKDAWSTVEESVRHSYDFSAGAVFPEAVQAIAHAVDQFSQRLSASIPAIRKALGIESQPKSGPEAHGMPLADWGRFHSSLALLRACGTIERGFAAIEARLVVRMREQAQRLFDGGGNRDGDMLGHSHKTSPQTKRKEFRRHQSGSNVLSLSSIIGEPTRVTTAAVMKWLKEEPEREKALTDFIQDLVLTTNERDLKIFSDTHASLTRYTHQVQTLVYDSVFAPISQILRHVHENECWTKTPDAELGDLPTFSTLPQEYITMVADLLLSLLPQLEPFAESSSLEKAAAASYRASRVCGREWAALGQLLRLSREEVDVCERIFDYSVADDDALLGVVSDAASFVDTWTAVVASGATAALLSAVIKIPSLSMLGAKQLEADIGYFQNVLNALSGGSSDRNFLIVGLQKALQVPAEEYAAFVDDWRVADSSSDDETSHVMLRLHEALLAKRKLPIHTQEDSGSTGTSQFY